MVENGTRLGVSTLEPNRDMFGLSLALGAGEVKPIELTAAFAAFANNGEFNSVATVLSVKNHQGEEIYKFEPSPQAVLQPEVAYQMNSILSDNSARSFVFGASSPLAFPGRAVAAKTGTTSWYKDAWTVGYTKYRAVGIWTGNSDGHIMRYGADGVFVAAPLWRDVLRTSMKGQNYDNFSQPEGLKLVNVSTVKGTRSEYLASWQITPSLAALAKNSELPSNPAWEKPVQEYWKKREEQQVVQNPPPAENTESPPLDVGGTDEQLAPVPSDQPPSSEPKKDKSGPPSEEQTANSGNQQASSTQ